jgi:hypothetical protein
MARISQQEKLAPTQPCSALLMQDSAFNSQGSARRSPVTATRSGSNGFRRNYEQRLLPAMQCRRIENNQ